MPQLGSRIELTAGKPGHGGFMVAHRDRAESPEVARPADDRVIFLRGALPGERVVAEITEIKKRYLRAETVQVLDPHAGRTPQRCPAAAAGAGCCDFAFTDAAFGRELKRQVLTELLTRAGVNLDAIPAIEVAELARPGTGLPTNNDGGWRHRARLTVGNTGRAGYFRARTHEVVPEPCTQLPAGLSELALGQRFRPGAEVLAVRDDAGIDHLLEVPPRGTGRPAVVAGAATGRFVIDLPGEQVEWDLAHQGFWQAHRAAAGEYARRTTEAVVARNLSAGWTGWDLYGGAGVFAAAALAAGAGQVHSVETAGSSVAAGRAALVDRPVRFRTGMVQHVIGDLPAPAVAVVDPPRSGAGREVIAALAQAGPELVVHFACDPAAGARDLVDYAAAGYRIEAIDGFDGFPSTHHLEFMATLVRS